MSQNKTRQEKLGQLIVQLKKNRSKLNKKYHSEMNSKGWDNTPFSFFTNTYYRLRFRWNVFMLLEKEREKYGQTTYENFKRRINSKATALKQSVVKRIPSIFRKKQN